MSYKRCNKQCKLTFSELVCYNLARYLNCFRFFFVYRNNKLIIIRFNSIVASNYKL